MSDPATDARVLASHEQHWIERIREGETAAFEEMYKTYYPALCRFAASYVKSRDEAHEVVQAVFLRLWKGRQSWCPRRSIKLYLYQAVRNQSLNQVRREQLRRHIRLEIPEGAEAMAGPEPQAYQHQELTAAVHAAIDELPERRRITYLLHRQHGLTYAEIGEIMGVSSKTVANQLSAALKHLRDRLAPLFL